MWKFTEGMVRDAVGRTAVVEVHTVKDIYLSPVTFAMSSRSSC